MSVGSLAKVIGYMLVLSLVGAVITAVVVTYLQPQPADPQPVVGNAWRSVTTAFNRLRGQGVALGRAVPGVDPPSIAERLATLSSAPASQHVVTSSQEVVMTGAPSVAASHTCLGGDNEIMLEVKNDIGADQIDISYFIDSLSPTSYLPRITKLASCGPRSVIKQCIPLAPHDSGVGLRILAYYYEAAQVATEISETPFVDANGMVDLPPKRAVSGVREENRKYPTLFSNADLKSLPKIELNASSFLVSA